MVYSVVLLINLFCLFIQCSLLFQFSYFNGKAFLKMKRIDNLMCTKRPLMS